MQNKTFFAFDTIKFLSGGIKSVIITTYNSPAWLQKVLWGYQTQTFKDFEMVIADDGSTGDTKHLIDSMSKPEVFYPIQHICAK